MRVLVLNPGSSTLKVSVVDPDADVDGPRLTVDWPAGEDDAAPDVVRQALDQLAASDPDSLGYRVVHGGDRYRGASLVDDALIDEVVRLDPLAPLHNLRAAAVMRAGRNAMPGVPHVACFDTAFHATLPEEAWRYPLPADWVDSLGIRRFGFHGLSVAWSTRRAAELLGRPATDLRLVVAHLGSGCSVTAVDRGRSVDTSMGFTPFEGLMMGTRSGSVDPGILLRLTAEGVSAEAVADGLAHRSGLLSIAGTSSARDIEQRDGTGDRAATLALAMFARRAAAGIAAAMVALPSLDAIVFTGGIGEHSLGLRRSIVRRLSALGVPQRLDERAADAVLTAGPPWVLVVSAREDRVIADQVNELVVGA